MIYGIAIILMIYHHLFAFPERFNYNYICVLNIYGFNIDYYIGVFGKICVALYAFISGYALFITAKNNKIIFVINQLINLYKKFWLIFCIFIPIGFACKIYLFDFKEIFLNFIGYHTNYNLEWWYVWEYVKMLIFFPIMYKSMIFIDKIKIKYINIIIFISIILCLRRIDIFLAVFLMGLLCANYQLFENFNAIFTKKNKLSIFLSISMLCIIAVYRSYNPSLNSDIFFAPILIYSVINLKNRLNLIKLEKILSTIGTYSIYMWLIHTFIAYYYFQDFIIQAKYSIVIFLIVFICSLILGIIFNKVYLYINKKITISKNKCIIIYILLAYIIFQDFLLSIINKYLI